MVWEKNYEKFGGNPLLAETLWAETMATNPFYNKGYKTNLNRFLSYLAKGKQEAPLHSTRLWCYLSTCLEQNYLGTGKLCKLLMSKTKHEGNADSTSSACPVESSVARAACNQLAVGTLVLLDRAAQLRERVIQKVCSPLQDWYTAVSVETRAVYKGATWLIEQLKRGVLQALQQVPGAIAEAH